jgi:anaerobic magnesium-protoporphyrin IX monomethyl ester cyclase
VKVLLVEPPKKTWELMGDCVSPPLGLAQLAAVLEEENIPVNLVDCNASRLTWDDLEDFIAKEKPDIVGATAITPWFYEAVEVARITKSVNPNSVNVLGGPHVTFTVEETLREYPEVDIIVRGEGDYTLPDLVRCLKAKKDLSQVKGIAFRDNGRIAITETPPLVDVNKLPLPAYHLLPMNQYYFTVFGNFTTIITSRGCPYRCTFCSEWRFWGAHWRTRNPTLVVDELEILHKKYGRDAFWIGDDCFNVGKNHIHGICNEIIKRKLPISWYYQGRADFLIKYQDLLPEMRRAGNLMVQIGIETDNNRELNEFHKNLSIKQAIEAVDLLKKNDIVSQGMMIIGTKNDNPKAIANKLAFMKWLDSDFPIFTMYTPFPGSDVYDEAKSKGWLETSDYSKYDMSHSIISNQYLSTEQINSLYYSCYSSYYLDPIKIIKGFLSRNSWKRKVWFHMTKFILKQIFRTVLRYFVKYVKKL